MGLGFDDLFAAGCPRVAGDEEEDDVDDLENEFNFAGRAKQDGQFAAASMLQGRMSYGRGGDVEMPQVVHTVPNVPLLTNGQMVISFRCLQQSARFLVLVC